MREITDTGKLARNIIALFLLCCAVAAFASWRFGVGCPFIAALVVVTGLVCACLAVSAIVALIVRTILTFVSRQHTMRDAQQPSPRDSSRAADGPTGTRDS